MADEVIKFKLSADGAEKTAQQFRAVSGGMAAANDNYKELSKNAAKASSTLAAFGGALGQLDPRISALGASVGRASGVISAMTAVLGGPGGLLIGGAVAVLGLFASGLKESRERSEELAKAERERAKATAEATFATDQANRKLLENLGKSSEVVRIEEELIRLLNKRAELGGGLGNLGGGATLMMPGMSEPTPFNAMAAARLDDQINILKKELAEKDVYLNAIVRGNIDLEHRPRVKNADGSISTVLSASFNIDGKEVLLPRVSDRGRILSENQTIEEYKRTGRHLGIYATPADADAAAERIHKAQELMLLKEQKNGLTPEKSTDTALKAANLAQTDAQRRYEELRTDRMRAQELEARASQKLLEEQQKAIDESYERRARAESEESDRLMERAQTTEEALVRIREAGLQTFSAVGASALSAFNQMAKGAKMSAGALLEMLGDTIFAQGQGHFFLGLANSFIPGMQASAGPLMAVGGAEMAFGTAIGAAGARSGGSKSGSSGGGGGRAESPGGGAGTSSSSSPTTVVVNVHGLVVGTAAELGAVVVGSMKEGVRRGTVSVADLKGLAA